MLDFTAAALPIALLIYWMTKQQSLPSNRALPLAAIVLYALLLAYFRLSAVLVHAAVIEGLLTALTPILIVWGAILLFKTMEYTGAMDTVRQWLNGITSNRVAQLMIVGWSFSFLVEGISGFGTPAALAAPLLVGLGFAPRPIAILCLIMNSVPVSFGAVGMPTWFGLGNLGLTPSELQAIGFKSAILHAGAALVIPIVALRMVVSIAEIRTNLIYIYCVIGATIAVYVGVASCNLEFPAIAGGMASLIVAVGLAKAGIGLAKTQARPAMTDITMKQFLKASFPLWGTLCILICTRLDYLPLKNWLTDKTSACELSIPLLGDLQISSSLVFQLRGILGTELAWSHAVLFVPSIIPFLLISLLTLWLFRSPSSVSRTTFSQSLQAIWKPLGAFLGALVFVKLLMVGGEHSCATKLGQGLAYSAGNAWQFVAVYLGALGSFFSGSNTVSNLTFGGIQKTTAEMLALSPTTILSLQSVGGAMGNMICIHNIVAVCSILDLTNEEGMILRKTFLPMLLYGAIAGMIALLL